MNSNVKTLASLNFAAQVVARSAVATVAERSPAVLAVKLLASPGLANGLKDFDYIVETLMAGGQSDKLQAMLDSRSLGHTARRIIVEKLLTCV